MDYQLVGFRAVSLMLQRYLRGSCMAGHFTGGCNVTKEAELLPVPRSWESASLSSRRDFHAAQNQQAVPKRSSQYSSTPSEHEGLLAGVGAWTRE